MKESLSYLILFVLAICCAALLSELTLFWCKQLKFNMTLFRYMFWKLNVLLVWALGKNMQQQSKTLKLEETGWPPNPSWYRSLCSQLNLQNPAFGKNAREKEQSVGEITNELRIMKESLRHPNIVRYHRTFEESESVLLLIFMVASTVTPSRSRMVVLFP